VRTTRVIILLLASVLLLPGLSGAELRGAGPIKSAVTARLLEGSPWDEGAAVVSDVRLSGFDPESDAYDRIGVRLPRGMKRLGRVTAYVTLYRDGREVRNLWASAWIKVYGEAVVALKPLRMKRRITASDVRLARIEVASLADAAVSIDEVVGMVVRRPLPAGAVVKKSYLRPVRLIRRGDRVSISSGDGRFRVRTRGIAVEDGYEGSVVTARTASGREVSGRVAGPGSITVEF